MDKCKREGCSEHSTNYPKYGGCCSIYCRDVYELEEELQMLRTSYRQANLTIDRLTEERDVARLEVDKLREQREIMAKMLGEKIRELRRASKASSVEG